MSSEIEVVEEIQPAKQSGGIVAANGNGNGNGVGINGVVGVVADDDESLRNDVYTAAAYGDLEKLQSGAALNNRTAAAQYIIEHGGDIHAVDHTGQTALHWSAVRGAIQVAELLLQEGARIDAADIYGYQVSFPIFVEPLLDVGLGALELRNIWFP
ncbi:hypothetical protein COLO4_03740 [Corchorus olitorius]|uniref:Uncharacterized protein n=1 Tax=Corchorus olitorius TaxID=93759 RepID=A0A1R3KX89_9ROSI|nr:hypothetical protein COLO4_03740 [Corchorus olitorius]